MNIKYMELVSLRSRQFFLMFAPALQNMPINFNPQSASFRYRNERDILKV
jgi:hypothetical protein